MIEIAALAQQTVTAIAPLLPFAATKAAEGFFKEPGAKLYNWLAAKLKGTPAEATLDRAAAEPANPRRLDALKLEIEDLAEKDSDFRDQLAALLKELPAAITATQTAIQTGDNHKSAQVAGKDNIITIT
jgi:hypothetical protein